jgi:hypothetical protein
VLLKCTAQFKSVFCANKTNKTSMYAAILECLIFQEQWDMLNYALHSITSQKNRIPLTPTQFRPQNPHDTGTASWEPAKSAKCAARSVPVNPHVGLITFNKIMQDSVFQLRCLGSPLVLLIWLVQILCSSCTRAQITSRNFFVCRIQHLGYVPCYICHDTTSLLCAGLTHDVPISQFHKNVFTDHV